MSERREDENKNNNALFQLLIWASFILKILVVVNANQTDADACHIGYMYEYVKHSLIASAVIIGGALMVVGCGGISHFTNAGSCLKTSIIIMAAVIFGAVIAMIVLMGKIWYSNPDETILFYEAFWKTPVECPSTIDSKWYNWAQVPVKYDAFNMMIGFVMLGLGACCFSICAIADRCSTDNVDEFV